MKADEINCKENELVLSLCSSHPSGEEIRWYKEKLSAFAGSSEESSQAMDAIIAGYAAE